MTRAHRSWSRPPKVLPRTHTRMHNLALVPASELASLAIWQERAHLLSPGHTLIVVPKHNLHVLRVSRQIKMALAQQGCSASIAIVPTQSPARESFQPG